METQTNDTEKTRKKSSSGNRQIGSVKIADDVVAMIAALAAMEVDGVSAMSGGVKSESLGRMSRARLARCVKVAVDRTEVRVDMAVMLEYGYNIPSTSSQVQNRVKTAIENMTGLTVTCVNVRIAEITMPHTASEF